MRVSDLLELTKGKNMFVYTGLGEVTNIDVISDKLMIFNPTEVDKEDFLSFLDGVKVDNLTIDDKEFILQELKITREDISKMEGF